jgi:succinate dehydrogenase / fumarate reductase cytochrome b subunit
LVFILLHVGMTRIAGLTDPAVHADLFGHMRDALMSPWVFVFYLLGLWLAVAHFANGLATAAISWGLTTSADAQRRFGWVCAGVGLLLGAIGTHGLVGYLIAPTGAGA